MIICESLFYYSLSNSTQKIFVAFVGVLGEIELFETGVNLTESPATAKNESKGDPGRVKG